MTILHDYGFTIYYVIFNKEGSIRRFCIAISLCI